MNVKWSKRRRNARSWAVVLDSRNTHRQTGTGPAQARSLREVVDNNDTSDGSEGGRHAGGIIQQRRFP